MHTFWNRLILAEHGGKLAVMVSNMTEVCVSSFALVHIARLDVWILMWMFYQFSAQTVDL